MAGLTQGLLLGLGLGLGVGLGGRDGTHLSRDFLFPGIHHSGRVCSQPRFVVLGAPLGVHLGNIDRRLIQEGFGRAQFFLYQEFADVRGQHFQDAHVAVVAHGTVLFVSGSGKASSGMQWVEDDGVVGLFY